MKISFQACTVSKYDLQVQRQVQLARNWLDALLRRFPEVALSIKTKKAARLLLSGERMFVERMAHEGVLEESEVSPQMTRLISNIDGFVSMR